MPTFQTFKDLSVTFNAHPNTSDLLVVKNEQAVKIALQNLLMTKKQERPFQSEIGSNIANLLFDSLDFGTAGLIKDEITNVINRYEPRVQIIDVIVTPEFDQNGFFVYIEFEIIGREAPGSPLTTEFLLERTR
jgi:phage baseplate assembly protein W